MIINAVDFDYGGVISLVPGREKYEELAKMAGASVETFQKALFALRDGYDRGTYDCAELYRRVLAGLGGTRSGTQDDLIKTLVAADLELWKPLNKKTLSLIEDLTASKNREGMPLVGVLTNMSGEFLSELRSTVPLFQKEQSKLDFVIASCELLLIKPEKAIYDVLLQRLKLPPEQVVFFDDNKANVDAACKLGIKAFVFTSADEARSTLSSLGLRFRA
jgi:putative hydrolase of the HAD superfamily